MAYKGPVASLFKSQILHPHRIKCALVQPTWARSLSSVTEMLKCPYIPRRTVMYVPGHDKKKLSKIPHLGVDCAVLECEDGVAINMKAEARKNIREALDYLKIENMDLALRVNSRSSQLMEADIGAIIGGDLGSCADVTCLPQTLLLPKVDSVEDLVTFTECLKAAKAGRKYKPFLLVYVESGQGLLNMKEVLDKAVEFSAADHFHIDGVVFGSDDFLADIGAQKTQEAKELLYARQKVVMTAKAFRLQVIDIVYVDINDLTGLERQAQEGAQYGFTGKQVIHPKQIATVQAAFTPSPEKQDWARKLSSAFDEHQKSGQGAFVFQGQMVDMPLLRQAKNILKLVENVERK
ncbi:citramalyl-CoA lyase, mitochondrial-like [Physella acuta]|uniref:citramalyl-CoA lyase, mitochondrial-like n=1 Tax=Physella acuta TaxID=109671 RepID=UPI0027DD48EA|nr:citramalyl-CoA lyase, mitochondrial-like [Physella acuta]XP_059176991.1 citramalyl-CoA lyase, mitochondrial-like [Physella acuta]